MNELATINVGDLEIIPTKTQVSNAVQAIATIVENGEVDPLKALACLTAYEKAFADAKKAIMEYAKSEAMKYTEKTISLGGAKFQLKETGVKYDYSGDETWRQIKEQMDGIAAELKGRETVLKSMGYYAKSATEILSVILGE